MLTPACQYERGNLRQFAAGQYRSHVASSNFPSALGWLGWRSRKATKWLAGAAEKGGLTRPRLYPAAARAATIRAWSL
jgi:hypothetical protein